MGLRALQQIKTTAHGGGLEGSVISDKEIETAAKEYQVGFSNELDAAEDFEEGAQWMRSELLKRSEQSFEEWQESDLFTQDDLRELTNLTNIQQTIYLCKKSWQAAQFSQAATVKQLREELAKKDERVKSLEWAISQALATPMIGELAKSILEGSIKQKREKT